MEEVAALKMRQRFGHYLDLVAKGRKRVLITRANRPLVVMIPADEYDEGAEGPGRRRRLKRVASNMDAVRRRIARRLGRVDIVDAVRRTRNP